MSVIFSSYRERDNKCRIHLCACALHESLQYINKFYERLGELQSREEARSEKSSKLKQFSVKETERRSIIVKVSEQLLIY